MPRWERELVSRTLTAFLREDVGGLREHGRLLPGPVGGGAWLATGRLRIPVRAGRPHDGDLVSDLVARAPFLIGVGPGPGRARRRVTARRLAAVLNLLAAELGAVADPVLAGELAAGFRALRQEAGAALTGSRLRRRRRPVVLGRLRPELAGARATGWSGAIGYETLAAHRDHPLHPFSLARVGLEPGQLPRFAPEHRPRPELTWLSLPAPLLEQAGMRPGWWPDPERAGDVVLPIHPALPAAVLREALAGIGRRPADVVSRAAPEPVRPTLSLRTVVPDRDPGLHLKLPLPIRTLGRLNLRALTRAGLADGARVERVLRAVLADEPRFAGPVVVADESSWAHAGHPMLAVLIRRWDGVDDTAEIVPVAALAATGPDGRTVIAGLAGRYWDGDLDQLIGDYLRALLDWQVTLWLRYGVALEAHPQNVLIAVDRVGDGPRLRLLLRDLDSARIDLEVAGAALGPATPRLGDLADARLAARHPQELADLLITTTLHQCVAAVLIAVAAATGRPVRPLLARVGPMLAELADRHPGRRDTPLLISRIITAGRLPVKRSMTAATLLPKTRTGASDVNKYYGADAPSYL